MKDLRIGHVLEGYECRTCAECKETNAHLWIRSLTSKPPRNASQRERNIYEAATRLLANLEEEEITKKELYEQEHNYQQSVLGRRKV